jgi:glycosyltransferase involved in cell wall biosynthesis
MRRLLWVHEPEMALLAGGQQETLRASIHGQGWDIRLIPYRPRMMWRQQERCDLLVWSFVPTQLDLWSTRHLAREQVGIIHELNPAVSSLPHLTHWLVPSWSLREGLISRGIRAGQMSVVGTGPAPSAVHPNPVRDLLGLPDSTYLIYAGGPLVPQTGGKTAIWALNILNYLHPHVHILLHGSGVERERLEAFMHSIDQQRRCHFLPACYPQAEVIEQVDQVWLPRQWDGVPDALYHALRAGRPILAADQPSLREWLVHEENAFLMPANQPPAWAATAKRLIADPDLAIRFGTAARQTPWNGHFSTQEVESLAWFNQPLQHQAA